MRSRTKTDTRHKEPTCQALEARIFDEIPVQSYCAVRNRRTVIIDIRGSAWRGQMREQSPQSWQTHGSRLSTSGPLNPRRAYRMILRGKLTESVTSSQEIVQLPHW
jgi:hypothetical protein